MGRPRYARLADLYAVIEQLTLQGFFSVAAVCDTLLVSRARFYAWRQETRSAREQRDRELAPLVYNRRVVGWELRPQMTEPLVLDVLQHAIRARQPPAGLVHHSDRGSQYAARGYRAMLRRAAIRQSMSRAGNCYDNAFMESCFGTIKTELEMTEYDNCSQAQGDIASYLAYYNNERRHSALDYLSPAQFETVQNINP